MRYISTRGWRSAEFIDVLIGRTRARWWSLCSEYWPRIAREEIENFYAKAPLSPRVAFRVMYPFVGRDI